MTKEYEIWFRDVDLTVQNLLANPDFADDFDFVPFREYGPDDERRYCDFFSADWAWEQAVCVSISIISSIAHIFLGYHLRG